MGMQKEQIDTNKTPTQIKELGIVKSCNCACKLFVNKKSPGASAETLNQEDKIKGMYSLPKSTARDSLAS